MLQWLQREIIATLGVAGAAATVLTQVAALMPVAPWLQDLARLWRTILDGFWTPPFQWIGIPVHSHLVTAVTLALFLAMIGVGARISALLKGSADGTISVARWLDLEHSPASLVILGALVITFLLGNDQTGPPVSKLTDWGRFLFGILVALGYVAGEFFGGREFHSRLVRLAGLVLLLVAASYLSTLV